MKRKQYIICILLVILLFTLTGCNGSKKIKYISKEELAACSNGIIELNKDNWEQFFATELGELTEKKTSGYREKVQTEYLILKTGCVMLNEKTELLLEGKKQVETETTYLDTAEVEHSKGEPSPIILERVFTPSEMKQSLLNLVYERDGGVYTPMENGEYREAAMMRRTELLSVECLHASGRMMTWDIPEEYWNVEEEDVRFLCIGDENVSFRVYELTFHYDMVRYLRKYGEVEQE